MTVDEIYAMMGKLLDKAIPENFKAANLLIDRQDKYVSAEANYVNMNGDTCNLDKVFILPMHRPFTNCMPSQPGAATTVGIN